MAKTMKAAVLLGEGKIEIQDRPIPKIDADGALVKVKHSALCGSDLHYYRGHINVGTGFISLLLPRFSWRVLTA